MKATLHFPLIRAIVFEGKKYKLRPYFDIVLKVFAIQKESELTEREKVLLSIELLIKSKVELSYEKQPELLDAVYDALVDNTNNSDNSQQVFDFVQDCGLIYSSFFADYGIDLYECQGRLHWWKFIQLFQGLSDKTKIVQVMQIRSKPIPAPTKTNAEERLNLMKLKAQYALNFTEGEKEKNFANGLKKLAKTMQAMAIKGGE